MNRDRLSSTAPRKIMEWISAQHRPTGPSGLAQEAPVQARTQWTGPWLPTHDRSVSASSKNYWYSAKMQIVIDANTQLTVAISRPTPGNRHDCRAYRDSGSTGNATAPR